MTFEFPNIEIDEQAQQDFAVKAVLESSTLKVLTFKVDGEDLDDHIGNIFGEVPLFTDVQTNLGQWLYSKSIMNAIVICEDGTPLLVSADEDDYPSIGLVRPDMSLFAEPGADGEDTDEDAEYPPLSELTVVEYVKHYKIIDKVMTIVSSPDLMRSPGLLTQDPIKVEIIETLDPEQVEF